MRKKRWNRSQITKRLLFQYYVVLICFFILLVAFTLFAWQLCQNYIWQPYDIRYRILKFMKDYILLPFGSAFLLGYLVITSYFFSKPLKYLDEIVMASEQLANPSETLIELPYAMKNIEDELNLVRVQALRNIMLAKEAEQRKNDLIVYLAHDLKTPLTSVIGYLTLLNDEPDIPHRVRARYTGVALEKAQRLEDLINEFFDITRFNLTTLALEPERRNLSRMLEQIASEFTPILSEKELYWQMEIAKDIDIYCDPDKLERVFDNLIRNAVNYSFPKSEIFLSMRQIEDRVEIRVKNHGKTIPPEKLGHIFEQFFRLDSSRSSYTGGAGLGLAIAKEIVELHGGLIRAESADEEVIFTVVLPLGL